MCIRDRRGAARAAGASTLRIATTVAAPKGERAQEQQSARRPRRDGRAQGGCSARPPAAPDEGEPRP
eukprot:10327370-Alexandrium_andersonii.AAC.1